MMGWMSRQPQAHWIWQGLLVLNIVFCAANLGCLLSNGSILNGFVAAFNAFVAWILWKDRAGMLEDHRRWKDAKGAMPSHEDI